MTEDTEVKVKQILINALMSEHGKVITTELTKELAVKMVECLHHLELVESNKLRDLNDDN